VRRSSPDVLTRESEFDDGRGKDERLGAVKINHSVLTRRIDELYADAQVCAQVAGLAYVSDNEPGIVRHRRGRGWSFRDAGNRPLTDREVKARILALAIPPAWRDVWICPDEDGHILAVGVDDKGRKQYLYHERWREFRDLLNFFRLVSFGERLPRVRRHVERQLRRRTLDRDQILSTMVRIIDTSAIRIGNEVYAEENDSYGLSTLHRRHARVTGARVTFRFPAKSGRQAAIELTDRRVATVVGRLAEQRRRRLFTVDRHPVDAAEVNEMLATVAGEHVTAKDFRTWRGTLTAFTVLASQDDTADHNAQVLSAVDATSAVLGNTRAVARAHYIHPRVLSSFLDGTFSDLLARSVPSRNPALTPEERPLLGFLRVLLDEEFGALTDGDPLQLPLD
jgi:DNA topoisomerase-1